MVDSFSSLNVICQAADLKGNLDTECFVFAVRHDKRKLKRVRNILDTDLRIKNCTRARSTDDRLSTIFHPSFEAVAPPQQTIQASGGAAGVDRKTA